MPNYYTDGSLPEDTNNSVAGSGYSPNDGTVAIQLGTVTRDGKSQPSAPVIIQAQAPQAVSGTLQSPGNTTGNGSALSVLGDGSVILTVIQTGFSGTVTFQGSEDGTNYGNIYATQLGTNTIGTAITSTTVTSTTLWEISCSGLQSILCPITRSAGTCTITGHGVPGAYSARVVNVANGNAASGAANAGNPLKIGGAFNTTQPTVTTGQVVDAQATARGSLIIATGVDALTATTNADAAIAPGAAPSKALIIGGVYNSTTPAPTNGQTLALQTDAFGNIKATYYGGTKATYTYAISATAPYATPQDWIVIRGSSTKIVKIVRIEISGAATAATEVVFTLKKHTIANTGGTSTTPTPMQHDSADAAASAVVLLYSVAPTIDATATIWKTVRLDLAVAPGATAVAPDRYVYDYAAQPYEPLTLRGVAQEFAINFAGVAVPSGGVYDAAITISEES